MQTIDRVSLCSQYCDIILNLMIVVENCLTICVLPTSMHMHDCLVSSIYYRRETAIKVVDFYSGAPARNKCSKNWQVMIIL